MTKSVVAESIAPAEWLEKITLVFPPEDREAVFGRGSWPRSWRQLDGTQRTRHILKTPRGQDPPFRNT
jgi:hypothetical protein